MPVIVYGIVLALAAAALYASGLVLQALEARTAPAAHALRPSLYGRLLRKPLWLAGTALGVAGAAAQLFALVWAPLTLVQPLLASGLVFVLAASALLLGERVAAREKAAAAAIASGVPLLALTAPERQAEHASGMRLWLALALLAAVAAAPLALRGSARAASMLVPVGAGFAYVCDDLVSKFASDEFARSQWRTMLFWLLAMGAAAGLGTLEEMSALQRRPVAQVAPVVFGLNTFLPVALAPLLAREWWPADPLRDAGIVLALALVAAGLVVLTRSSPVGRVLAAEASSSERGTARNPREPSTPARAANEPGD
jgi:drug/metabolite transporter (DMT)-like permease